MYYVNSADTSRTYDVIIHSKERRTSAFIHQTLARLGGVGLQDYLKGSLCIELLVNN